MRRTWSNACHRPKLTIAGYREYARFSAHLEELWVTGLRLAGLPEE
jgi:hypothetical protein